MGTKLAGSLMLGISLGLSSCSESSKLDAEKYNGAETNIDNLSTDNAFRPQPQEIPQTPVEIPEPPQDNTGNIASDESTVGTGNLRDCREDYPTYGWKRTTENECAKVKGWMVGGGGIDGVLPGAAFVTCKIDNECMRFATVNNCDYEYWPKGKLGLPLGQRDQTRYCRKDYKNYTFFRCFINDKPFIGQSVDGTSYQDFAEMRGNIVHEVAANLPLNQGCLDKVRE